MWNNQNAFKGNAAAMDSISFTYLKLKTTLADNELLKIKHQIAQAKLNTANHTVNFLKKDSTQQSNLNKELKHQLVFKDQKHQVDLMYYKEKAKGKFTSFLLGTAIGGLIVALLTLVI